MIERTAAKNADPNIVTNYKDSVLFVQVENMPINELLKIVTSQLNINYFVFSELKGNISIKLEKVNFATFIKFLLNGTDYTYKNTKGIYLIGDRKLEEIRTLDIYTFRYRTVNKVLDAIPNELKKRH